MKKKNKQMKNRRINLPKDNVQTTTKKENRKNENIF